MNDNRVIIEAIGYVGTALVLISFLMTSVYKLRIINTAGSLISVIYGVIMQVYPTVVLNGALALINIFFLWRHLSYKNQKIYTAGKTYAGDPIVKMFLDKYREEIIKFFPSFGVAHLEPNIAYLIMCEDTMAGVMLGNLKENGELDIYLDFVTGTYRDFSVGKYLYRELTRDGVKKCRFMTDIPKSYVYLRKVGYKRVGDVMELTLNE
ncbi:MAG: hypothetical protein J6X08_00180 [Lachnospiraceae bacterium]|nr:hypothetical protein [Lachnospiraceae bacterium]